MFTLESSLPYNSIFCFCKKYNEPEWRKFSATRNHLIHGYFIVDYDLVWDLVKNKLPQLEVQIKDILIREKNLFD